MVRNNQIPKYTTIVQLAVGSDDLYYIALHPEIENCFSDGETVAEALANLEEVTLLTIEHLQDHHLPIPAPRTFGGNRLEFGGHRALLTDVKHPGSPKLQVLPITA